MRTALSLLIHDTDYAHAIELFALFVRLFDMQKETRQHDIYWKKLKNVKDLDLETLIKEIPKKETEEEMMDEEMIVNEFVFSNTKREKSKFYQDFFDRRKKVKEEKTTDKANALYTPALITYLLNEKIPYYPVWSGILLQQFGLQRKSNACVESWNKIIKHNVFKGEMRQLIPRAITTLKTNVCNRLLKRKYERRSTKAIENKTNKRLKKNEESDVVTNSQSTEKSEDLEQSPDLKELSEIEKEMLQLGILDVKTEVNVRKKKCRRGKTGMKNTTKLDLSTRNIEEETKIEAKEEVCHSVSETENILHKRKRAALVQANKIKTILGAEETNNF